MVTGVKNKQYVSNATRIDRQKYQPCPASSTYVAPNYNTDNISIGNIGNNTNIKRVKELKDIKIGKLHAIPDSIKKDPRNNIAHWYFKNAPWLDYKVEKDKGINYNTPGLRDVDVVLAKYAQKVANEMSVATCCYTGTKHALWAAGVLDDYGDMPKGSAHQANEYFDSHPKKFEKVNIDPTKLKKLPAGIILVYEKDGKHGHIDITNGKGQGMSDCFDNLGWIDEHGEGSTVHAYRLTDGWKYNPKTKKLEFEG